MTTMSNPVQVAVARLAEAQRKDRGLDPGKIADARNGLVAARLEREVLRAVRPDDPLYEPLRAEDRRRIAELLLEG
jgi:hypothetical protein